MEIENWRIYFVPKCRHAKPIPKDKLVVIFCIDSKPFGFFINSVVRAWVQKDRERLASQAKILASEHPALVYDSYVDCLDLYPFNESELTEKRGLISNAGKKSIRMAVQNSKTIVSRYKDIILASL